MNMSEEMKLLVQLQKLDVQIYAFEKIKAGGPLKIRRSVEEFRKKGEALNEEGERLKALQVKQNSKENDLLVKEEQIKKCQTQLYQIKTNKEYAAMQQEIKGYGADKSVLEDEIIAILDETDNKKDDIEKEKTLLEEEEKKLDEEKAKINSEVKDAEERLGALYKERADFAGRVDKQILSKYERILKGKEGMAIVPVLDDACGGCHLNLPPQVINVIKRKQDLILCESCARILYIEE